MMKFNIYRRRLPIMALMLCGAFMADAQTKIPGKTSIPIATDKIAPISVNIKIRDIQTGAPLDSIRIYVAGAGKNLYYTDKKGEATIADVPNGADITVRGAGYLAQTKKAKGPVAFNLVAAGAEDASQGGSKVNLDMMTRYPDTYTGFYHLLSGEEIRSVNPYDVLSAIAVLDPSVQVVRSNLYGDDPNVLPGIQIRGTGNFPAAASIATASQVLSTGVQTLPSQGDFAADEVMNPNRPLILLNGVQISVRRLVDLDINTIDKVVVLKDAVATAPYGSRGAGGVLLIQTYPVKKGKMNIAYTGALQAGVADMGSYHLLGAPDKLNLEKNAGVYTNQAGLYQQRLYNVNKGIRSNWLEVPLQRAVTSRNALRAEGGDDNFEYGLNVMYNSVQGNMKGTERQNVNLDLHLGARVKNAFFRNTLQYGYVHQALSPYGNLSDYAKLNPYWSPYDSLSGQYAKILDQFHVKTAAGLDSVVTIYNPAYNTTLATQDITNTYLIHNTTDISWWLGNGLHLTGYFSIMHQNDQNDMFLPPDNIMFANTPPALFFQRGLYNQTTSVFNSIDTRLNIAYSKQIGLHGIDANAGVSLLSTGSSATGISVQGFTSNQLANIAFGSGYSNTKPATGMVNTRWVSGFATVNYNYDRRYLVDATLTEEGASQYSANNRYNTDWAVGLAWNVLNEHFLHPGKIISQIKLTATTGVNGNLFFQSYLNNNTYNYLTSAQYILGSSSLATRGIGLGAYLSGVGNPGLYAPRNNQMSIGAEIALLNNRVFISGALYKQESKGLVLPVYSPAYAGYSTFNYYDNLGGLKNSGAELSLKYLVIQDTKHSIFWSISANAFHNTNTITATSSYIDSLNTFNNSLASDQTGPKQLFVKGQSLDALWVVHSAGIDPATGREQFIKADGSTTNTWSAADKQMAGHYLPTWQGAFGSALTVKRISFTAFFNYQTGASVYNQTLADKVENADLAYNVDARAASNRWALPGQTAPFKALSVNGLQTNATYLTSRFVEKNNWINCASLALSYGWAAFANKKIPLQNLQFSFIANNVFRVGGADMERGIYTPFARMYSFKITTAIK